MKIYTHLLVYPKLENINLSIYQSKVSIKCVIVIFLPLTTPSSSPVANTFSSIKESAVTKFLKKEMF